MCVQTDGHRAVSDGTHSENCVDGCCITMQRPPRAMTQTALPVTQRLWAEPAGTFVMGWSLEVSQDCDVMSERKRCPLGLLSQERLNGKTVTASWCGADIRGAQLPTRIAGGTGEAGREAGEVLSSGFRSTMG